MRNLLVVVDMQNDFIDGSLGTKEAVAIVDNVIAEIAKYDTKDIFATRDTHLENYLETQEGKNLPVVHCVKGTDGWQINSDIMKSVNASYEPVIIDKPTFASLELGEVPSNMVSEGDVVDFCGVCTGICVISNLSIAKATIPEVTVRLIENATACVTKDSKEAAVKTAGMIQVEIV